jgi:hypothetical protein
VLVGSVEPLRGGPSGRPEAIGGEPPKGMVEL